MKTFEGQRKFQAPVADDFSRAMLAIEHMASDDGRPPKHTGLISSLTAWWRR
ncbi:type III secretion effector protein [Pseudomonas sp. CFBP13506]|uniref:Type III secretion effector protein n=3 Tax=Pseudomonas TaxID=286 RepID=A0A4Y9T892_PSEFL|nr:type III secretion effector protein [Pseudomonas asgharzadehiana]TFW40238.1 type III secretion effector protein [Pseudomonas fluorescens]TKJ55485.1 type III secretion effector protein [Pseudomonas sp. CFBP13506]